jgi:RHS repeat-associated protein
VSYPLYDARGNSVGLLGKNGSSSWFLTKRVIMLWGGFRTGTKANGKAAYCANLGHKQDDESGFIYMRARYYEPTSGRFVSEDSKADGGNWFSCCMNNPVNAWDKTGGIAIFALMQIAFEIVAATELIVNYFWHPTDPGSKAFQALTTAMAGAIASSIVIAAAIRSDGKYAMAATGIASMVLAVSMFVIAHQCALLMMLNSIDDDSDLGKWELFQRQAGQPEGCFGL